MKFQSVADVAARLRSPGLTNRDLYTLWEQRQPVPEPARDKGKGDTLDSTKQIPWLQDGLGVAIEFAASALQKEEFLLVCDCAREALRLWGGQAASPHAREPLVRLRMHYAAALDRLGYSSDARRQLEPCVAADFQPALSAALQADVLLQIGNILRDESVCAPLRAARDQMAGQALDFYLAALQVEPGRLEAEALATAAGFVISQPGSETRLAAQDRARRLLARAQASEQAAGRQYVFTYFRAVAHAVLGALDEAAAAFGELAGLPGATTAHLADARFWARTLAEGLELPSDFFRPAFPPLQLIVFSGHPPDHSDRQDRYPRFPLHAIREVGSTLATALDAARASVGMVSAAAGADLLFAEALSRRPGAAFHLILPWEQEEFRRTSITPFEPAGGEPLWEPMFRGALERAASVRVIGQMYRPKDAAALMYTMEVTAGLALHSARAMRLDLHPMALWDGRTGHVAGGTDSFVEFWRQLGYPPTVLHPPATVAEVGTEVDPSTGAEPVPAGAGEEGSGVHCERDTLRQEVKTLLFADIVGYSKLSEVSVPQFIGLFLEAASQLTAASAHAPRFVNTWGDAICAVFDFAQDAGCYAMELIQLIRDNQEEWIKQGLGATETLADGRIEIHPLNIRVGLHSGPVFLHYNPMVRQLAFTGVHVNRAARIEPVTPHGEVFASEEFTALAELDRVIRLRHPQARPSSKGTVGDALSFTCEYAGSMTLAKGYPGWHRLYRVAPHRVFALEALAKVIHEDYCAVEARKGHTVAQNPSMRPWADLPETLRDSDRAQAADIPNKLEALGYELAPSFGLPPASIVISDEQAAAFSAREHERWMQEKRRGGWTFGPTRDNDRKLHPSMIPWEQLSIEEKDKDRAAVQNVPRLIEKAGFRVRKIGRPV